MVAEQVVEVVRRLVAPEHRRSEADIQAGVRDLLLQGDLDLLDDHVRLEAPARNRRRVDVEVGSAVIEVKKDLGRGLEAAREQLAGYLQDRQAEHGGRYLGVLTDGVVWHAYRCHDNGDLRLGSPPGWRTPSSRSSPASGSCRI